MRFVAPSARSSRPRTTIAADVRATVRKRVQSPAEQMTLSSPVSSSRDRNVTPCAVPGRWRWVTTPATATRDPSRPCIASSTVMTPLRTRPSRTYCVG